MIPHWQELSQDKKQRIVNHCATFAVDVDKLEDVDGMKLVDSGLAHQMAIELYMLIRGLDG
jgi:hypothetical protein